MVDIINGGVYAVDLGGIESYEFKGVHPALVVRTLKEEQMYVVIPLTTYTEERWEKCKRKGFGARILSTNSIARVDKMNIVSKKCIRGRYYNAGDMVVPDVTEVARVLKKVTEYIDLSNQKTLKEYNKYMIQRAEFEKEVDTLCSVDKMSNFSYQFSVEQNVEFVYPLSKMSFVSNADIKAVICEKIDNLGIDIKKTCAELQINIKLNPDKLLTFKNQYDKFKAQKGGNNA